MLLSNGVCGYFILPEPASYVFFYAIFNLRNLFYLIAVHANTYGIYPSEIAALQKDYADLWEPLSELLKKLSAVIKM